MRSLIWFRNDLRVTDNATLNAAVKASTEVIPVFILDPAQWSEDRWGHVKTGPFRTQFLLESLADLKADLEDMGGALLIRSGEPAEVPADDVSPGRPAFRAGAIAGRLHAFPRKDGKAQ